MSGNQERTLAGLTTITCDVLNLSSNVETITIDGYDGAVSEVLKKNDDRFDL